MVDPLAKLLSLPKSGRFFLFLEKLEPMDGNEYVGEPSIAMYTPPPPPPINVTIEEKKSNWSWANFFSCVAAVAGLGAFFVAYQANEQSEESLNLTKAQMRFSDSVLRANDSISSAKEAEYANYRSEKDSLDRINNDRTWKAQLQLVDAQLNAIGLTQEQFLAINQPYIELFNYKLEKPVAGSETNLTFYIINVNDIPAKMLRSGLVAQVMDTLNFVRKGRKLDTMVGLEPEIRYFVKGDGFEKKFSFELPDDQLHHLIYHPTSLLYIRFIIEYENLVTNDLRRFETTLGLKYVDGATFLLNKTFAIIENSDNITVRKSK